MYLCNMNKVENNNKPRENINKMYIKNLLQKYIKNF